MNARENLITTLDHKEPEYLPIDLGSTNCTSITRVAYNNLREFLHLPVDEDPIVTNRVMDSIYPKEDLLEHYKIDFRSVSVKPPLTSSTIEIPEDESFYDDYGIRWKKASYYYDAVERPLADASVEDLKNVKWIDPYDPGLVEGLKKEVETLYKTTEWSLVADIICDGPFESGCMLRGYENFLTDLHINRPFAEALMNKITETDIILLERFLDAVGDYVDVVAMGDDVGMQTSTYVSPEMYREIIKPYDKRIFDLIHSKTKAKLFYHSCGSVYDIIPDFIEIGVDILSPVQTTAAKMELSTLKKEFGNDIVFWGGGVDIQEFLPMASIQEFEDHVRKNVDTMMPGGGYVFFATHNLQADTAPEKIDKVYETLHKFYR
ncbi:MAG: hypothetical protein JSV25_05295 [Spirochaetota bacterium]|nr:MAG: hypothetical protein JSV25_05295 [Spirochaetota bacterium]